MDGYKTCQSEQKIVCTSLELLTPVLLMWFEVSPMLCPSRAGWTG